MNTLFKYIGMSFLLLALLPGTTLCQNTDKERLAILPFGTRGLTAEEGTQLRQLFAEAVDESMRYEIPPLASIRSRLAEKGLRDIDSCNTLACLAELGKILTAEKVVYATATRHEQRFVLHIQVVNSSNASLLYDERVDHTGEFSTLLSDVIPAQGRKLAAAYLDKGTPWYYVAGAILVGVGLIYWIFVSWGSSVGQDSQDGNPHPTTQ
jgi:hypothetical protein